MTLQRCLELIAQGRTAQADLALQRGQVSFTNFSDSPFTVYFDGVTGSEMRVLSGGLTRIDAVGFSGDTAFMQLFPGGTTAILNSSLVTGETILVNGNPSTGIIQLYTANTVGDNSQLTMDQAASGFNMV